MAAKIKSHPKHRTSHSHKPRGISHKAFEKVYWPYIPLLVLAVMVMSLAAQNGVLASVIHHPTGKVLSFATSMSTEGLLNDTNNARAANNVSPLYTNAALTAAAQTKANDMVTRNYWSHDTPSGQQPWIFVAAQNYDYQKVGENLAAGFNDPQSTINGWMSSTHHRENMLDTAYNEVGFGFANNPNYTAAGGGPMTVVVAFYGLSTKSAAAATVADKEVKPPPASIAAAEVLGAAQTTNRAQLAFANSPLWRYASIITVTGLFAAATLWISRHALNLRRVIVQGESFVIAHPLMDVSLMVFGFMLFALSRTAGFIH